MSNPESVNQGSDTAKSALPREPLIKTAVTFLSDRKIQSQDPNLLRRFLLKKGLTEEEASIAFQRLEETKNVKDNDVIVLYPYRVYNMCGNTLITFEREMQRLVAEFSRPQQNFTPSVEPLLLPASTLWTTVHNVVTTITSIGGLVYALYWIWKTYISPYLFGRKPKKKPVEVTLGELEAAVGGCVADVKGVRTAVEMLAEQRTADLTGGVLTSRLQDVKADIASLKTLLLSRNQFPATPAPLGTGQLSIPAWQLSSEDTTHPEVEGEGEVEEEGEGTGSNRTTNGSDSSLEIVKDPNH